MESIKRVLRGKGFIPPPKIQSKWQDLAHRIIEEIPDVGDKKGSLFGCCKKNYHVAERAFTETKELGKLNIMYFFKVYHSMLKKYEKRE